MSYQQLDLSAPKSILSWANHDLGPAETQMGFIRNLVWAGQTAQWDGSLLSSCNHDFGAGFSI